MAPVRRVLLLDDDEANRRLLELELTEAGFEGHACPPERVEAEVRRLRPGAVLIDYVGVAGSRPHIFGRVRALGSVPVLVTAWQLDAGRLAELGLSAADYFQKPYDAEQLARRLHEHAAGDGRPRRWPARLGPARKRSATPFPMRPPATGTVDVL